MTTANATPKPRAGEHVNDAEAWMHAACLTIAETGQKWGENVHPSPAMQVVYELRKERDLLREREKELVATLLDIARDCEAIAEDERDAGYKGTFASIASQARGVLAKARP